MPNIVSADRMQVGHKGGGKHWTKREVAKRQAAAQKTQRKGPIKLTAPEWLKSDLTAYRIWRQVVKDAQEIELLDNLDANTLATYCKLEAAKEQAATEGDVKQFDKLAKTALLYAKSLGLTPEARARLAKRRAEEEPDPNADLFE